MPVTNPITSLPGLLTTPTLPLGSELMFAIRLLYETSFFWLPVILVIGSYRLWINYKQMQFIHSQKSTLLEARLPADILKSPLSMELVLTSLHQTGGESTWIDRLLKGKSRPWFSLELVSLEGQVKFYIWTRPAWKNHIESQIYSQFPGIEVFEVPDYTLPIKFEPDGDQILWGCEYELTKPDPYPIKTYVDNPPTGFGMIQFPGTPTLYQVDPMSPTLELLASLGPGEQAWIQIIIRAHKKDRHAHGRVWYNPATWFAKADWKRDLKHEIDKIEAKTKDGGRKSKTDEQLLDALNRSTAKLPFETGIRALYIAKKEHFNPITISGLIGSFRQYNSNVLNGFKHTRSTGFDYPWQDYKNIRLNAKKRSILDAYKRRAYFMPPHKEHHFILNTEELATVYHFPSATVTTPSLNRVISKKGEPPRDLPI